MKRLQKPSKTVTGKRPKKTSKVKAFACAALLTAGLALTGCEYERHCYNRDVVVTVQPPEERPPEEQPQVDPCENTVATLDCTTPRISITLHADESIQVGDNLIVFTPGPAGSDTAEMRVMGMDCEESGSSEVNVGDSYPISSAIGAEDGYMQVLSVNSDSVEIEASLPLVVAGDINTGESLMVPVDFPTQVSIRLDDISIYPTNEPPSALLSIISDDIVVDHMDLPEGTAKSPGIFENLITVGAPVVSPGYTFGAIRVELELFYCGPL